MKKIILLTFLISSFALSQISYKTAKFDTIKTRTDNGWLRIKADTQFDSTVVFFVPVARAYINAKIALINGLSDSSVTFRVDTTSTTSAPVYSASSPNIDLRLPFARMKDTSWSNSVSDIASTNSFLTVATAAKKKFLTFDTTKYATAAMTGLYKYSDYARTAFKDESNTFSSGTTQTMDTARITTLIASPAKTLEVAESGREYTSIQTAINAADSGDVVFVHAGTYTENLTIPDTGITVKGIDRNTVVIDGRLIVTGKSNTIMGVGITDTLQIKCYAPYDSTIMERNAIIDCTLSGDVFVGAVADSNISGVYFENCFFNGDGKTFLINHNGYWRNRIFLNNCYTQNYVDTSSWRFNNMVVYGDASVSFNNCKFFCVQSILLDANKGIAHVEMQNFGQFVIGNGGLSGINNSVNWTVFSVFSGYALHGDRRAGSTWTLDGKFEFNIWNSRLGMPDVVYNSVANSRWEQVVQVPYQSSKTLSGTGLSVLYVTNSIFRMSNPTGLGGNAGTRWEAFIDD